MTDTTTLPPLTAASPGVDDRDGVLLAPIGDDGEALIALGQNGQHLPRQRVYDAMKAYDSWDTDFAPQPDELDDRWAICIPCDGKFCDTDGGCTWHIQWSTDLNGIGPATPGAFPVTVWEA